MKLTAAWSYGTGVVAATLQVLVPVCMLACGPASAENLASAQHPTSNVTPPPAHPHTHHSQDPHPANQEPACGQAGVGIVRVCSGKKDTADTRTLQLFVFSQLLVVPNVVWPTLGATSLTRTHSPSVAPLALTLRL